jgi:hypothetical protein
MNDREYLNKSKAIKGLWNDAVAAGFSMASGPLTWSPLRTLASSKLSARFLVLGADPRLKIACTDSDVFLPLLDDQDFDWDVSVPLLGC